MNLLAPVLLLVAIVAVVVVVGFLVWYLLFETEGVYLGRGVVVRLYDWYASRYDDIKKFDDITEHLYLAQPIMRRIRYNDPLVLDVATGTGRLPLALCQHASFEGTYRPVSMPAGRCCSWRTPSSAPSTSTTGSPGCTPMPATCPSTMVSSIW